MHLGSFPACIHNSIHMHAKHEQILNCHCFNISHITSHRTFWGLIFGSQIFWVLIFAPIRSFLLLEVWSTPLVHTDYYCSEKEQVCTHLLFTCLHYARVSRLRTKDVQVDLEHQGQFITPADSQIRTKCSLTQD